VSERDLAALVSERWAAAAAGGKVQIEQAPDVDAVMSSGEHARRSPS
jgi:acetyl-CoA C-acetyltransferase